ncbi:MAG: toprim domain-containing protein [Flavisolibacter sp.]
MLDHRISCREVKEIDLILYLQQLGYKPSKITGQDNWYLSPFRNEKTPSFKVNRKKNLWFDFGEGMGGTIIDFGIRYYKCSVQEFLKKLGQETPMIFSFHQPVPVNINDVENNSRRVLITDIWAIADPDLRKYLHDRHIPLHIANRFCSEIEFEIYGEKQLAIGFKNDLGGYELRNLNFKGSSSPKSITLFKNNASILSVFEGFFDFLSFQTELLCHLQITHDLPKKQDSYLVLNSLTFFSSSRALLEKYQQIHLYLDRDESGLNATVKALQWSEKYIDQSHFYDGFKDLSDFHFHQQKTI